MTRYQNQHCIVQLEGGGFLVPGRHGSTIGDTDIRNAEVFSRSASARQAAQSVITEGYSIIPVKVQTDITNARRFVRNPTVKYGRGKWAELL